MHDTYTYVKNFLAHPLSQFAYRCIFLCLSVPYSLILSAPCLINRITSKNCSNTMGEWHCHHRFWPFLRPSSMSHTMSQWTTSLHSISALPTTHLPSPVQTGYMNYSLGIQNAFGMSLAYIGVHLCSSSKRFKSQRSVFGHHVMFQLKNKLQSFFTPWSQG